MNPLELEGVKESGKDAECSKSTMVLVLDPLCLLVSTSDGSPFIPFPFRSYLQVDPVPEGGLKKNKGTCIHLSPGQALLSLSRVSPSPVLCRNGIAVSAGVELRDTKIHMSVDGGE